jgi:hypothetical protein
MKQKVVSLCSGSNCCPDAIFSEDGSVTLQEGEKALLLSETSARILAEALRDSGYLDR